MKKKDGEFSEPTAVDINPRSERIPPQAPPHLVLLCRPRSTGFPTGRAELSTGPVDRSLSHSEDTAHAYAMSNIDGCPECVLNSEKPVLAGRVEGAWRCKYVCSDCGHSWTTDWRD